MVIAALAVIGLGAAVLLALAAITIARVAISDESLLVGGIALSTIMALLVTIFVLIGWGEPIVWWRGLLAASAASIALFALILLGLIARGIWGEWFLRRTFTGNGAIATARH